MRCHGTSLSSSSWNQPSSDDTRPARFESGRAASSNSSRGTPSTVMTRCGSGTNLLLTRIASMQFTVLTPSVAKHVFQLTGASYVWSASVDVIGRADYVWSDAARAIQIIQVRFSFVNFVGA